VIYDLYQIYRQNYVRFLEFSHQYEALQKEVETMDRCKQCSSVVSVHISLELQIRSHRSKYTRLYHKYKIETD
jgi:hypothetical protein